MVILLTGYRLTILQFEKKTAELHNVTERFYNVPHSETHMLHTKMAKATQHKVIVLSGYTEKRKHEQHRHYIEKRIKELIH